MGPCYSEAAIKLGAMTLTSNDRSFREYGLPGVDRNVFDAGLLMIF
jgi:hypothetical protein